MESQQGNSRGGAPVETAQGRIQLEEELCSHHGGVSRGCIKLHLDKLPLLC